MTKQTQSRMLLAGWLILTILCLTVALSPGRIDFRLREETSSDINFYEWVAKQVTQGEGYYSTMSKGLPQWGYPSSSVFNWRPPLPLWALGMMRDPRGGRIIMGLLAVALLFGGAMLMMRDQGRLAGVWGGLLLSGATLPALLPGLFYFPILWGSVLMGLSICCFGWNRPRMGVASGVAAALFRELAIGYCLIMWCFAAVKKNRREWIHWSIGILIFVIYFSIHAIRVSQQVVETPISADSHWVQFNGLAFVISTAHLNGLLLPLPQWVSALYFSLAVGGMLQVSSDWQLRAALATVGYWFVFLVVGQSINQYWGLLVSPLLCYSAAHSPVVLASLWKTATRTGEFGRG